MKLYRYEDYLTGYDVYTTVEIREISFDVVSTTPKGYYIDVLGDKKWVSKTSRKRYAYPTRKEAMIGLKARKYRQTEILTARLDRARSAFNQIDNMIIKEEENE